MGMTRDKMEFTAILARECPQISALGVVAIAQKLMRLGATFNRMAVEQCNREWTEADEKKRERIRQRIMMLSDDLGFDKTPRFQNDPRGCTVKLRVPSGRTNDWGQEGICVPTA